VRDYLRIRVGSEANALLLQALAQETMVFDDAVLDHRHLVSLIQLGMGIANIRLAVGGPAGMANAAATGDGALFQLLPLQFDFSLRFAAVELAGHYRGQTGGIVAPILKALQTFQQKRDHLAGANRGHDATHTAPALRVASV